MAESWLETIAERQGITPDALRENLKKESAGCVIRALESITGVRATDQEWKLRLEQVDIGERESGGIKQFEKDAIQVESLVKSIASSGSPIGRVLQNKKILFKQCSTDEIRQIIERGDNVISLGIMASGNKMLAHAAHLGYKDSVGFVSISDNNQPIGLKPGILLRTIVFVV